MLARVLLWVLLGTAASPGQPAWSPDSLHLFRQAEAPLAASPRGHQVVAGGPKGVAVWDLDTGKRLSWLPGVRAVSLSFSLNGRRVAVGQAGDRVTMWDWSRGSRAWSKLTRPRPDPFTHAGVAFAESGSLVYTLGSTFARGSPDHYLRWWSGSGQPQASTPAVDACRSRDGRWLWIQRGEQGGALVDPVRSTLVKAFPGLVGRGFSGSPLLVQEGARLQWLDPTTGTLEPAAENGEDWVAVGPERTLVFKSRQSGLRLELRHPQRGNLALEHPSGAAAYFLLFSPDGSQVLTQTTEPARIFLWDARTGQLLHSLASVGLDYAFTADGRFLTETMAAGLRVLDLRSYQVRLLSK